MSTRLASLAAVVVSAASATGQTQLRVYDGAAADDRFGWEVCAVGDVDGDGRGDLAVGAPWHDTGGADAGRVVVLSGADGQTLRTWDGAAAGDRFGYALAPAGDLDGDGLADVVVGAPQGQPDPFFFGPAATGSGYARVVSGATGATLLAIGGAGPHLGASVAAGGDVDGDGIGDLLVGAPGGTAALVVSGATGATLRTHVQGEAHFGFSLAFLGDVNGDAASEYAVGAPQIATFSGGLVRVFDGAGGGLLWQVAGSSTEELGFALAGIGDLDGDDLPDLLAGGRQDAFPTPTGSGRVRVLSGAAGTQLALLHGATNSAGHGFSLAPAEDLDGDGVADFCASQPGADPLFAQTRPLRIYSGRNQTLMLEIPHAQAGALFGVGLATGDVTGDLLPDVVIGEPYADASATDAGRVFVYTVVRSPKVYCAAKVNSQGCTPSISWIGTATAAGSTFRALAQQVLDNQPGVLVWSAVPQAAPFQGGLLCVQPPLVRTPVQSSGGNPPPPACSGTFAFHFTPAYLGASGLAAGDEVFCQYWSRDPAAASGSNLTDALAFFVEP